MTTSNLHYSCSSYIVILTPFYQKEWSVLPSTRVSPEYTNDKDSRSLSVIFPEVNKQKTAEAEKKQDSVVGIPVISIK